ncbi:MAG: hypothetical protein FHP92_16945 [Denitromonas halophila]|nr:MAG: hypothetical protein FHP92_16945 [Denitromonas halophila]
MDAIALGLPLVIASSVIILNGCFLLPDSLPPTPAKGFQCLPVPTEWNEPGSLFYVDNNGDAFRVGKVPSVDGKSGIAAVPTQKTTQSFNVGVLIKTLELLTESTGWSGQLGISGNSTITIRSEYQDVIHVITDEPQPNVVSDWFTSRYSMVDGNKYYLIRESLAARSIDFAISSSDFAKIGGQAKFKQVAEGKLEVLERKNEDSISLKKTLSKHVNVCIKAQRLVPASAGSGAKTLRPANFEEVKVRAAHAK